MDQKKVLIIGLVWPEPTSSAAGKRMIQLVNYFLSLGSEVIFASAASKSKFSFDLQALNVNEQEIKLNDNSFNTFLKEIDPDIILFDRFMTEEQYGWRVLQECPKSIRILDTEDLHCLRYARQQIVKTGDSINLFTDVAKREIASILRCDLSLMISEIEMDILQQQFHVDSSLIFYLPFLEETIDEEKRTHWKSYEERDGFTFIGNFLHEPNWNTLQVLKKQIWPALRKKIPSASLHVYGAYAKQKVLQLHNIGENFYVHGRAKDAETVLSAHKVLIAPIRFGAGAKGKFIDAMQSGTPCVTSTIGAESMNGNLEWNGAIEDDNEQFIRQAQNLYLDKRFWLQAQQNGIQIINERYGKEKYSQLFTKRLETLVLNLSLHRQHNFVGQLLQYHTLNSTKYMSLWIEEKNKHSINE